MELLRASMDPASHQARRRTDSPACQVVLRAAKADLAEGGLENINQLAIGAGVAAAGLTAWLAEQRKTDPAALVDSLDGALGEVGEERGSGVVEMLKALLTGPPGMKAAAELMVRTFREDEEAYYDLVVDLGDYAAACVSMLSSMGASRTEDTLGELEDMLRDFFND
ncbi:hypothetical protein ACFP1Z_28000 [Streptomyces gamaensis]|uniref:Uncharacterized protein n=1 Tax=Streptomyces gamaensis TaxID=1763542 RepID=A0ABW0Z5P1_9ACTN